jgi:hypothetical protein
MKKIIVIKIRNNESQKKTNAWVDNKKLIGLKIIL